MILLDSCGLKYSSSQGFSDLGLQINDIEPFCQDEIALYRQCAERRVRMIIKELIF